MTTEFSTSSLLEVSVSKRSLKSARKTIQSELGGVTVDVNTTSSTPASGSRGVSGLGKQMQSEANQLARKSLDVHTSILKEIKKNGASTGTSRGRGGLISGLVGGVGLRGALGKISTSALVGTAATVTAGALIAGGAYITADALIEDGANVKASDLIVGGASITAGALIASGASVSAGSLVSAAAVVPPAALIAGAATISAGVLISDSATVTAGALVGSAAVIGAGALISSPAVVAAGALVGSAAIVSASDIIAGKVMKSDLFDEMTSTSVDDIFYGDPNPASDKTGANDLMATQPGAADPAGSWHNMGRPPSSQEMAEDIVSVPGGNTTVDAWTASPNVSTDPPDRGNETRSNQAAQNRGDTSVEIQENVTVTGTERREVERIAEEKAQEAAEAVRNELRGR